MLVLIFFSGGSNRLSIGCHAPHASQRVAWGGDIFDPVHACVPKVVLPCFCHRVFFQLTRLTSAVLMVSLWFCNHLTKRGNDVSLREPGFPCADGFCVIRQLSHLRSSKTNAAFSHFFFHLCCFSSVYCHRGRPRPNRQRCSSYSSAFCNMDLHYRSALCCRASLC